jgi:hypothetical protein
LLELRNLDARCNFVKGKEATQGSFRFGVENGSAKVNKVAVIGNPCVWVSVL